MRLLLLWTSISESSMSILHLRVLEMSLPLLIHSFSQILHQSYKFCKSKKKSKAIPVTGLGGIYGCMMLGIPHCLDNRLTVNCEILVACSSTYSPVRTSQEALSVSIK
jgi:hypothetical protein